MNAQATTDPFERLDKLSESLFGEADEISVEEANELLQASRIDPKKLKNSLYRRAVELRDQDRRDGKKAPKLLEQMIRDLEPPEVLGNPNLDSHPVSQWISQLISSIRQLPQLLNAGGEPLFSTAYRKKNELTSRDKETLDRIAEEMKERFKK